MNHQVEMVTLKDLVDSKHPYRKFVELINIDGLCSKHLSKAQGKGNYKGYGINNIFKALLIQHLEDLSDRELARYLKENNASKWFCQFRLTAITPDHTVFTRARKKIGGVRRA